MVNWREPGQAGYRVGEGQSLHSRLRRGWYFGSESFRERLNMGATGTVSRTIAEARKATEHDRKLRGLGKRLAKNVNSF